MRIGVLGVVALLAAGAGPAAAETLKERLNRGASNAARAIDNTARAVGDTVDSTVALARGEGSPEATRAKLDQTAADTLARLFAENPEARAAFDRSAGYAVFDTRRSVLLGIAAGFGRGVAVPRPAGAPTYMRMATGGVGYAFGYGGFESQVVILFETPADLRRFVVEGHDATAQAAARAGAAEADRTGHFVQGQAFYALGKKGWRVSATATGTKYWPDPVLNQGLPAAATGLPEPAAAPP
jgi:hypothetical protein